MRFLIIGENHPWSAETGLARCIRAKSSEAFIWSNKNSLFWLCNRNWWQLGRVARAFHDLVANLELLRTVRRLKPNVLFLPKAENIHSRAVKIAVAATGARLITWYPDHPFKSSMTSMNILRNLPEYDLFYIWGRFLIDSIQSAGAPDVRYLPFAFDPETHQSKIEPSNEDLKNFGCEVCFIGAWDKERERDLEPLASFDLAIWGPGWLENLDKSSPLRKFVRGAGVYNENLVKAYKSSKIVFNHLRLHNGSAHNVRSMEIAGIGGGVQVVRRTPELSKELFQEDEHLVCFQGHDELKQKIQFLLDNPTIAKKLSASARKKVFSNHLLKYRIEKILYDLKSLDADQKE
jgi:spore maturation protein CgeB